MREKANDWARIQLMLESIDNINEFLIGVDSFSAFDGNKLLRHAVIYNLQCIGESVYMLSKEFRAAHTAINWDVIEGLRHVLVHDYYQVNMETVWGIIQQDLSPLAKQLTLILEQNVNPL